MRGYGRPLRVPRGTPPTAQGVDHDEIVHVYGPWLPRTPSDAADLFDGYAGRWWIAGGWAIEAFTGIPRLHDDLDPSTPRSDVDACVHLLAPDSRAWLRNALDLAHPGHPWSSRL